MKQRLLSVILSLVLSAFLALPVVAQTNATIVKLETGDKTITVGDSPVMFYDDGGADGDIAKDLQGTVTFTPQNPSKKIMIDFTKMSLATGSMRGQTVYVYNGTKVTAENLLATFNGTETGKVKSTSPDGALTVRLKNDASIKAAGWEATVSQFDPLPMKLDAVEVAQYTEGTVCAGDLNQPILSFNLKTSETAPVLKTQKFRFTTNGTQAQVGHATLYFTKATNKFATTKKLGEAEVTADEFEITTTEPLALFEGNNYFWLAYDIKETVTDGQKIDASLTNVRLSDADHAVGAEGNPDGDRTVENIVVATDGTKTINVNNSIKFKSNVGDATRYEGGNQDRIVIFKPMHAGKTMQIDFESFYLAYSSSSYYGVKAKFVIYEGQGTRGKVLWELKSTADKEVGPGKTIRSEAADGALTVLFNPKEHASPYTDKGWVATVSEYAHQPMALKEVTANQLSTEIVAAGAKDQEIISFNIKTVGDQNKLTVNGITLDMKESRESIAKVTVLGTAAKDDAAGANVLAEVTELGSANTINIAFAAPVELAEGDNWFRIRYDVKDEAAAEKKLDAAITAIKLNDQVQNVTADPKGERIIKNILNLKSGNNGTKVVPDDTSLMFYDDGGESGKESKNFDGTITFAPVSPGYGIKLTAKNWTLVYGDKFRVSYGAEAKATPDKEFDSYNKLDFIVSKSADGKLTVNYKTGSYVGNGFAVEVTSVKLQKMAVKSVKTVAVAPEQTLKGQTDLPMLRVDVEAEGDFGSTDVTKFIVNATENAIIGKARIYATDTVSAFSTTKLFAEGASTPYEFDGKYTISDRGVYKFWVAYDIVPTATVGQKATAELASVTSTATLTPETAVTATTTVKAGFSGNITVGHEEKYKTIQSAIDAVSSGIEGPVNITVKPGIYKEHVNIPQIPGMSAVNVLTIESSTGNYNDVKIYNDNYISSGYSDDQMAREYGIVTFDGGDYVTLRGVEIYTEQINYPAVVRVRNVSQHVTIENCYLHAPISTNYQQDINLLEMYSPNEANKNNDYITVKNNIFEGGYKGLHLGGTSYVKLPKEIGGQVVGNTFRNQGAKAIYAKKETNVKIIGNTIENNTTDKSDFNGLDLDGEGQIQIEGNKFYLDTKNYSGAIYVRSITATAEAPASIINNVVIINSSNNSTYGIKMGRKSENVNVAHNTVRFTGTATKGSVFWANDNMSNVNLTQNLLQNDAGGYIYRFYKTDNVRTVNYSKNNIFTTGKVLAFPKKDVATFDDWKAMSNETGSFNEAVEFLDAKILEPKNEGNLRQTSPLAYVTTDVTGATRDAEHPTIGAYEFDATTDAPQMATDYPSVTNITDNSAVVNVKADKNGKGYIVIKKKGEPVPTKDEIIAAGNTVTFGNGDVASYNATGLEKDDTYVAYIVLVDLRGNQGEVVASKEFVATSAPAPIEMKAPKVVAKNKTIALGEAANLKATISEGKEPYTVKWVNGKHEEVATDVVPTENDDYIVTVTDANGMSASDTCRVMVTGDAVTATFENLYLDKESYWNGRVNKFSSFVSGTYEFDNKCYPEIATWFYYGYSNRTSTTFSGLDDQFNSAVGHGVDGSENYGVAFPQNGKIKVTNKADGDLIRGFYITNTAWVVDAVKNGDGMSKPNPRVGFQKGDFFKLIVTGNKSDGTKKTVDFYLADYRSEKEADHYVIDSWEWLDLRELGEVKSLTFKFDGTKRNGPGANGTTTPWYFCFDNFNGERPVKDAGTQSVAETMDIASLFTPDGSDATITYEIVEGTNVNSEVKITDDGKLVVTGKNKEKFTVVVKMTQAGKSQYVRIPVDYTTGIHTVNASADDASVKILSGEIVVTLANTQFKVEVYTTSGLLVEKTYANGRAAVRLPQAAKGIYVVKIDTGNKLISKSIVVK